MHRPQVRTHFTKGEESASVSARTPTASSPVPGTAAIGTTVKYRVKSVSKDQAETPLKDFMEKLKLAWDIFFPEKRPELSAKEEGKQRLRMILVADRCGLSPVGLTEMKKNILKSIEDFVDIESEEQIEVSISLQPDIGTVYSVAVPIRRVKPEARLAFGEDGDLDDLTFEYNPDDFDSDPSERFPMGT